MNDTKGQMHVLEVLLVATLFTSAVNVSVNILPTNSPSLPPILQALDCLITGRVRHPTSLFMPRW